MTSFVRDAIRDGSKIIGQGGRPEQRGGRGGGSSVFEPLVRGGSFNFQLPIGVGHPGFFNGIWHS